MLVPGLRPEVTCWMSCSASGCSQTCQNISCFYDERLTEKPDEPEVLSAPADARPGSEECLVRAMVDELPLAQSTVSQHLKVLREMGLIHGDMEGARICYCVHSCG